jgi:hypothetical protein
VVDVGFVDGPAVVDIGSVEVRDVPLVEGDEVREVDGPVAVDIAADERAVFVARGGVRETWDEEEDGQHGKKFRVHVCYS